MATIPREMILYALFTRAYEVFGDDSDDWMLIGDLLKMGPEASEESFDDILETHSLKLDGHLLVMKESESPASRTYDDRSRHASSSGSTEEQSHIQKRPPDALVFALAWSHFLGEINPNFGKLAERHGISESEAYAASYQFCFVLTNDL
ncbi:hypothetical protein LTR67_008403 [Exophiala xenobiotica]